VRALLPVLLLCACTTDPITELVLVVDTDFEVPDQLDAVEIVVDGRGLGADVETRRVDPLLPSQLPLVTSVVHRGGAFGPVVVEARGLSGGEEVVTRRARLAFAEGRSALVRLDLERRCRNESCGDGRTCVVGRCESDAVDPDTLPPWPGSPPRLGTDSGVFGEDAGELGGDSGAPEDVGPPDAGPPDAGPPDAGAPSGGMCDLDCDEDERCECSFSCDVCKTKCKRGDHCRDIRCTGDCELKAHDADEIEASCVGERCEVDARNVSNVRVTCVTGTCEVDCSDTSNCEVACRPFTSCRVDCDGASNCRISGCVRGVEECGGHLYCNYGEEPCDD